MPIRFVKPLLAAVILSGINLFFMDPVFALRCGNGLISIGDSKYEVLSLCGKPLFKERVSLEKEEASRFYGKLFRDGRFRGSSESASAVKFVEKWYIKTEYYGAEDVHVVVFVGDTVAEIYKEPRH